MGRERTGGGHSDSTVLDTPKKVMRYDEDTSETLLRLFYSRNLNPEGNTDTPFLNKTPLLITYPSVSHLTIHEGTTLHPPSLSTYGYLQ